MTIALVLSDREAEVLAEVRRHAAVATDADLVRLALYRLAVWYAVEGLDPSDFRLRGRPRSTRNT